MSGSGEKSGRWGRVLVIPRGAGISYHSSPQCSPHATSRSLFHLSFSTQCDVPNSTRRHQAENRWCGRFFWVAASECRQGTRALVATVRSLQGDLASPRGQRAGRQLLAHLKARTPRLTARGVSRRDDIPRNLLGDPPFVVYFFKGAYK